MDGALAGVQIRQGQFGIDHLDVIGRGDLARHVDDVLVLEAAHHVTYGFGLADVGQELVAQTLALGGARHQTGDVHELHGGRHHALGLMMAASWSRRGSGMGTTPVFGSMVQNGKLAASMPALVSALNRVDLPTLGRPTIPHLKPMNCYLT